MIEKALLSALLAALLAITLPAIAGALIRNLETVSCVLDQDQICILDDNPKAAN